jgi:hypothetical protein
MPKIKIITIKRMDWAGIEPAASPMPRARNTTLPPAQRSGKISFHDGMKQGRFGLHHARKAIYPWSIGPLYHYGMPSVKRIVSWPWVFIIIVVTILAITMRHAGNLSYRAVVVMSFTASR